MSYRENNTYYNVGGSRGRNSNRIPAMKDLKINHNGNQYTISSKQYLREGTDLSSFDFSTITEPNFIDGKLNLSQAKLKNIKLPNSNLEDVILVNADLRGTNLKGANLSRANLSGANLSGINTDRSTNFNGVNLSGAIFSNWDRYILNNNLNLTNEQIEQLNTSNLMYDDIQDFYLIRVRQPQPSINQQLSRLAIEMGRVTEARSQAEIDVITGLTEEQRGMQQAEIARKQKEIQERLKRATAQALLANEEKESVFGICPICQESINFGDKDIVDAHDINGKKSGHIFHKVCLEGWCGENLKVKCPLCSSPDVNCIEIKDGSRDINTNLGLKGGKRSKRKSKKRKVKSNKKRVTNKKSNKKGKKRATNKRGKRRVTNKKKILK